MKTCLFFALVCVLLIGCKSVQPQVQTIPINYRERIVERLVPVVVSQDSSSLKALFECDSLNNVVLKQLIEQKSKGIESSANFDGKTLNYKTKTVHDTIYVSVKDSFIYQEKPVKVPVPFEVNKLTNWQKAQIKAGNILFLMLGFGSVYLLIIKRSFVLLTVFNLLKWLKSLF